MIAACEPPSLNYDLKSPGLVKSPDKITRTRSLERHPSFVMDITYVTERIIVIVFPKTESDATYKSNLKDVARMLRTKHGTNYMVFNLSEKRHDLAKLNPQVLEFGWPQHLAPPLERLCSICKSVDSWVNTDPQNIAVLHSKGDKGRAGVVVAAYMHYSNICASADHALDRFAMKQFYDDKLSSYMQPSQKRYVHYFAGLLSGAIRMNNNPLYLHHIVIHGVPNFDSRGGCKPFVKIYQGMQHIYSSGVYSASERSHRIMINLDSGLQIRGDILVKCYHKSHRPLGRFPIFRLQFHTCTIDSECLTFEKIDLDDAVAESRFPENAKVEFKFSYTQEDFRGNGSVSDAVMPVEDPNDPLVKWDSYENFDTVLEDNPNELDFLDVDLNHEGPLDGSLYATVSKKKYTDISIQPHLNHDSLGDFEGPHSIDSGISSNSGVRNTDADSHNPSEHSAARINPHSDSSFKDEQAELDELVHGMLQEIQSIPDAPAYSTLRPFLGSTASSPPPPSKNFSDITTMNVQTKEYTSRDPGVPTSIISVNGNKQVLGPSGGHNPKPYTSNPLTSLEHVGEEEDIPYHARKSSSPFSYSVETRSPAIERHTLTQKRTEYYQDPTRFSGDNSQTWLQRQQEKLKARREGRTWEDRQQKEQQLMAELRLTQHRKGIPNEGESTDDVSLGLDFSSSSRENSPSKGMNYTLPLHVNTYNGYPSSSSPTTGSLKPPVYRNTSAPSSPLLPNRSSSREVTRNKYPQFQNQSSKALTRQKSDTSFDRERPFVTAKRAHQVAKEQIANNSTSPQHVISSSTVYSNIYPMHYPKSQSAPPRKGEDPDSGLLVFSRTTETKTTTSSTGSAPPGGSKLDKLEQSLQALSGSSGSPSNSPEDRQHSPFSFSQSTPNKTGHPTEVPSWSPSAVSSSPPSSPARSDRPETPAFPVPPGTPYQNQETSSSALPPKSPATVRKDRSPSPATVLRLQQDLPNSQAHSTNGQSSPTVYFGQSRPSSMVSLNEPSEVIHHHPMFVKDTSKYWYKPNITREDAITLLKDKPPGTFVVRDSNSFPGAYGLALKVATPPPNVQNKSGDISTELVRHFLIEPTSKGVRLKGCPNEPVFGSLSALVYQHSITALALPCKLLLPESDLSVDVTDDQTAENTALLAQGAACSVLYLNSVDTESLTGPQAVKKALTQTLAMKPLPTATPVHFKVSNQGITLTDNTRKLFFRRHYPVKTISHCGIDQDDRRWTQLNEEGVPISTSRCFGFIARKPASQTDNQCHLFAELEPEQPASAIVNFVTKVMMSGTQQNKSNMV